MVGITWCIRYTMAKAARRRVHVGLRFQRVRVHGR